MISKKTMTEVATKLADLRFEEHYKLLDDKITQCLIAAFKGERISIERANRIISKFCTNMQEMK